MEVNADGTVNETLPGLDILVQNWTKYDKQFLSLFSMHNLFNSYTMFLYFSPQIPTNIPIGKALP